MIARYLIEDNDCETIEYDENRTNSLPVVRSILRHFLGNYEILAPNKVQATIDRLAQVCRFFIIIDLASKRENHDIYLPISAEYSGRGMYKATAN